MDLIILATCQLFAAFYGAGVGKALAERRRLYLLDKEDPGAARFKQSWIDAEKNRITHLKREARLRGEHIVP